MLKGKTWLFIMIGILLGVVIGALIILPGRIEPAQPGLTSLLPAEKSLPLITFSLPNLVGEEINLEDLRGKPVVINFWATWCKPCEAEMPLLNQVYAENAPDLVVLGVNVEEDESVVRPFVDRLGIDFPILLDDTGEVYRTYLVRGFPTTFFVDAEGALQGQHIGELDADLLDRYLKLIGVGS